MARKIIQTTCFALDAYGKGLFHYRNKTYACSNLLVGEKAKIDMTYPTAPYVIERLNHSLERVPIACDKYSQCGGCQIMHLSEKGQRRFKTEQVKKCFQSLLPTNQLEIPDCIMQEEPWYYRNKIQMPIVSQAKKGFLLGFYKENSIEIIEKDDCLIQAPIAQKVLTCLRQFIQKYRISGYDWQRHRGTLKYVLLRYGFSTQELLVVIVTAQSQFKYRQALVSSLIRSVPEIKSIVQNVNTRKDHLVLDREEHIWYGKGYIMDQIGDVKFLISPKSFYQINPWQVKKLYDCILAFADLKGQETVIDAYCGVGTIGLYLAKKAHQVYGVDLIVSAIDDAKRNARLNHIANAAFRVQDAPLYMRKLAQKHRSVDVVIVDPPRSGCTSELLDAVLTLQPEKFIYVSCNIETQVRDLKYFLKGPYRMTQIQPFDLFPQTYHIENVVLLSKIKKDPA